MKIDGTSKTSRYIVSNKDYCPFRCWTCEILKEFVKSRYEIINILADDEDSIFSSMHEKYDEDHGLPTRSGQVFISVETLEKIDDKIDLIQKGQARLRRDLVSAGVLKAA
jgi:hypothetical protein